MRQAASGVRSILAQAEQWNRQLQTQIQLLGPTQASAGEEGGMLAAMLWSPHWLSLRASNIA